MVEKRREIETLYEDTSSSHPCEDVFDIESNSTLIPTPIPRSTELVEAENYDNKDVEIEDHFQEIFDKAMDVFDESVQEAAKVEGKYRARNMEVSAVFLQTALAAAREKANQKNTKDALDLKREKLQASTGGRTVNNMNLHVSTSELIKLLKREHTEKVINPEDEPPLDQGNPARTKIIRKKKEE